MTEPNVHARSRLPAAAAVLLATVLLPAAPLSAGWGDKMRDKVRAKEQRVFAEMPAVALPAPGTVAHEGSVTRTDDGAERVIDGGSEPFEDYAPVAWAGKLLVARKARYDKFERFKALPWAYRGEFKKRISTIWALFLKDLAGGEYAHLTPPEELVTSYAVSADGKSAAYATFDGKLYLQSLSGLDLRRRELVMEVNPAEERIKDLAFSGDGDTLLLRVDHWADSEEAGIPLYRGGRMTEKAAFMALDLRTSSKRPIDVSTLAEIEKPPGMFKKHLQKKLGGKLARNEFWINGVSHDGRYVTINSVGIRTQVTISLSATSMDIRSDGSVSRPMPERNYLVDIESGRTAILFGKGAPSGLAAQSFVEFLKGDRIYATKSGDAYLIAAAPDELLGLDEKDWKARLEGWRIPVNRAFTTARQYLAISPDGDFAARQYARKLAWGPIGSEPVLIKKGRFARFSPDGRFLYYERKKSIFRIQVRSGSDEDSAGPEAAEARELGDRSTRGNTEMGTPRLETPAVEPVRAEDENQAVLGGLTDPDWRIRKQAALDLGGGYDEKATTTLIAALKDPHKYVRGAAARALGAMAVESRESFGAVYDMRPVPPLVAALRDRSLHVRASAAKALGEFGDERAAAPLRNALKDPSSVVRKLAREAIAKMGRED